MSAKLLFDDKMDAEAAGAALAKWVAGLGFRVRPMSPTDCFGLRSRFSYAVKMAGTPEMRRIVFLAGFNGVPNHRDPDGRVRLANRINLDYNICKAAFDDEGTLYLEHVLHVEGELTSTLFSSFLIKADENITWLSQQYKAEFDEMIA